MPEFMTPELARWLGYLTAEGDARPDGTIRFANVEDELRSEYCQLTADLFGIKPRLYDGVVQLNSVALLDLLMALGFKSGAYNKEIPQSVLASSRECFLEFLSGYFAGDGTVGTQGRLSWTTASAVLATQLQVCLLNLGVVSTRFTSRSRATGGEYHDYWTLIVAGTDADRLASLMLLLPTRKRLTYQQRSVTQPRSSRTDVIPNTAGYWSAISMELQRVAISRSQAVGASGYHQREGARQVLGEDYTNLHMLRTSTNNCTRGMATKILGKLDGWVTPPVGLATLLNPRFSTIR